MKFTGFGLEGALVGVSQEECSALAEESLVAIEEGRATLTPSAEVSGELSLCVKFPNEPVVSMATVSIASVDAQEVTNIINVPHRVFFTGAFVAAGDRVGVMVDGVCDRSLGGELDEAKSVLLTLNAIGRFQLCYRFSGFNAFVPVDVVVRVVMESLRYEPAFVVSGASNTLVAVIPAFNPEDTVTLNGVQGVSSVRDGQKVVSFSTMDLEEDTVTLVYKHAYAGQITMTLPVYRVALSEEGTYYNLATEVQVTGAGEEKVSRWRCSRCARAR